MSTYESNATIAELAARIRGAERIALVTHRRPDGDALGSVLALARGLDALGQSADVFVMGSIEEPLKIIAGATPYRRVEHDPPGDDVDCIIVVDTGAWTQLEPLVDWLRRHHDRVIGIDHHAEGDAVASLRLVDTSAASTTLMLLPLLEELGCPITHGTGGVAELALVGLATDTGWFRFSNADARAFGVAAQLLECGVDKSTLYQTIEETYSPARLAIEARALASVEFAVGGVVAIQNLRREDLDAAGGTMDQLTGLVNRPMIVGSVRISILLLEIDGAETKVSLRGKPPLDGEAAEFSDVNHLARQLGGGGHVFASGARLPMGVDDAVRRVRELVEDEAAVQAALAVI